LDLSGCFVCKADSASSSSNELPSWVVTLSKLEYLNLSKCTGLNGLPATLLRVTRIASLVWASHSFGIARPVLSIFCIPSFIGIPFSTGPADASAGPESLRVAVVDQGPVLPPLPFDRGLVSSIPQAKPKPHIRLPTPPKPLRSTMRLGSSHPLPEKRKQRAGAAEHRSGRNSSES